MHMHTDEQSHGVLSIVVERPWVRQPLSEANALFLSPYVRWRITLCASRTAVCSSVAIQSAVAHNCCGASEQWLALSWGCWLLRAPPGTFRPRVVG